MPSCLSCFLHRAKYADQQICKKRLSVVLNLISYLLVSRLQIKGAEKKHRDFEVKLNGKVKTSIVRVIEQDY